ncbi:MAG: hypothetical protein ACLUKN_17375 [Bacilli bacterium]
MLKPMMRTYGVRERKSQNWLTQLGNQGHTIGPWRNVLEWYKNGIIGEVKEMVI